MVAKNDITGDSIQSRGTSESYRDNYDLIWGNKKKKQEEFELESLDPDERSWYYDDNGIKRRKEKEEVKIKAQIVEPKIKVVVEEKL